MTPEQIFDCKDPGIGLFGACLKAGAPMTFTWSNRGRADSDVNVLKRAWAVQPFRVLEIGCCEADWLHKAHQAWPEIDLVGIDWRAPNVTDGDGKVRRMQANGLDPDLFPAESFDAVVSLSAIEHFGLGHYDHDPVDPDGDSKVMANIWKWLKPGGWVYFDVPYDPTGYRVKGTEYRVYDDRALSARLELQLPLYDLDSAQWQAWTGYVHAKQARELIPKPTEPASPFYYVANVWRKA